MSSVSGTWGFQSISANITGPGGNVEIAYGSGSAEEGITIEPIMDQSTTQIGADGFVAHNLSAATAQTVTARFSKLGPANKTLFLMLNLQRANPKLHGVNTITLRDHARSETIVCERVAISKVPPLNYAKEAGVNEWTFDAARVQIIPGD